MTLRTIAAALGAAIALAAGALAAGPAAAWTTQAGGGTVLLRQVDSGWTVELRCQRGVPDVLAVTLVGPRAGSLAGVTSLAIGAELPSGTRRGGRIPVVSNGQVAQGTWSVNDRSLEIFAQGLTMAIQLDTAGPVLTTDMTGTAVGRSSIRSECGF